MRYIFLSIFLSALFVSQMSFGKDMPFVIPSVSKMVATEHNILPNIEFTGQEVISGIFQFSYSKYATTPDVELYFYPDKTSLEKLPFLTFRNKERAIEIYISNNKEAANILLGKLLSQKLHSGAVKHLSGESTILIDSYVAGYECDSPFFMAKIIKQIQPITTPSDVLLHEYVGC